jgi:hypothetical protein
MKYIGAVIMILVGILIIGLTATIPGFTIMSITSTNSTVTYNQTSIYPSSTDLSNPTIFPSATSVTVSVTFSTGYDFTGVQSAKVTGQLIIWDFNASTFVKVYSPSWSVTWQKYNSTEPYYKIVATSSYTFNNPIQGGQHVYEFTWNSKLTYNATVIGSSSYTVGTIYATGTTVFGKFSPVTVYPGYFMFYNCTSSWSLLGNPYGPLTYNFSQINIKIPSSQSYAYLEFIYVEYNATGNSLAGFNYTYLTFTSTGSAQWRFSSSNTTTYNGYPALYLRVKLSPGTYTINGYAVYNYGQNGGLEKLFDMTATWSITSTSTSSLNLNIGQIVSYVFGTVLIFAGVIDAWRWHI